MKKTIAERQRSIPASIFRGMYFRVAVELGMDASYVSRVARGLRRCASIEKALDRHVHKALTLMKSGKRADSG